MAKKRMKKAKKGKEDDSKLFAFLATFLSIIGFVIVLLTRRKDKYVMYYAGQSLAVFVVAVIAGIIQGVFVWIPIIGWIINASLSIVIFILWLVSWIYALSGEMKPVPVVGVYGENVRL